MECRNSALCIFDKQAVQTDVMANRLVDYHPINSIQGSVPIEFHIPGTADEYIDVNDISLKLIVKVTKSGGGKLSNTDKVGPINLPLASLFSDVSLTIGETQVHGGQFDYPFTSYLLTATQFQKQAQDTHMKLWGWERDEAGKFDDDANPGHVARMANVAASRPYELYGPLFLGITRQERYLISLTDLRIKLTRASPKFSLLATGGGDYQVRIEKAILYVRRIEVNPSVIEGHSVGLEKRNAVYQYLDPKLIVHTITKDSMETSRDNIFPHQMPKTLFIAMVDHEAYSGHIKKNPFNFQHYDLNKLAVYRNGQIVQGRILEPSYKNDQYSLAYGLTMRALKMYNTDDSNGITYADFKDGYNIYVFDLTADADTESAYRSIALDKGLRLEASFESKLPENANMLIMGLFDCEMEITKTRNVFATKV